MPLAVNPRNIALLNRVPYLSVAEYSTSPEALDLSNLVQGGSGNDQTASLARVIARASSWIDQYCFPVGSGGTLAASLDTDNGWSRIRRDGYMPLICRFKPVLELDSCSFGWVPSQLNALVDTADIIFGEKVIWIPTWGVNPTSTWPPAQPVTTGRAFAQWSYVDGYPHTVLTATATAGTSALDVASTLGAYPGTQLVVNDDASTETVTVSTVTPGILTLAAPLVYTHTPPAAPGTITVSALPAAVNQAAILLVSVLLETRGDNSIVLDSSGNMTTAKPGASGADQALSVVGELLDPFRIVT